MSDRKASLSVKEARAFADRWLPAWTGNDPDRLASFYSDDVFYLDPGVPQGLSGKDALLAYFRKLLHHNPNWVWSQLEAVPMEHGFLNKWLAKIPVGDHVIEIVGVCLVQLNDEGEIRRNEVYFDRTEFMRAIAAARGA
ncbi:MAG: nuclear transport factor 2 family protein [Gammaproteobacteria bacterium]